ncbi:hypothetical protein C8F01DRAFT_1157237 [Mycena amicta]|nr:hypothetical protein C8F01DRAFT_1157237 [Mycena amicta]
MPLPPHIAIYSGYSMSSEYFKELVLGFSRNRADRGPLPDIIYVGRYDSWRRRLPDDDHDKAPLLIVVATNEAEAKKQLREHFSTENVPASKRTAPDRDKSVKMFFSTRWEDYPEMAQETELDRARRDELIALIKRRNQFSVDPARLHFEPIEYRHPAYIPLR